MTSWSRLERYARFRSFMRLPSLPDELLAHVCSFLCVQDKESLFESFTGVAPAFWQLTSVQHAPILCVREWFVQRAVYEFAAQLKGVLAENSFFHAVHSTRVVALGDWSPFQSPTPPLSSVLCDYSWVRGGIHSANVAVHEQNILRMVVRCMRRKVAAVRVVFHKVLVWNECTLTEPDPTFVALVYALPVSIFN